MIQDLEKREVEIVYKPNAHFLITGKSGTGKTFYCCRKLEEELRKNKAMLLIDYSSSYTEKELQKNKFQYRRGTEIFDISDGKGMTFHLDTRNMTGTVTDALIHALDIKSYYQKKILNEAIVKTICIFKCLKIEQLFSCLERMGEMEEVGAEYKKNVGHLLTRLAPYKEMCAICFKAVKKEKIAKVAGLTIIKLSSFPKLQRKFLTNFLLEVIWREVRGGQKNEVKNTMHKLRRIKQSTEEWSCKNMKKQIYDEKNGLSYTLHGDYYLPDLEINEKEPAYGKYGIIQKQFLKEHRSARYQYLVLTGKLTEHLNQVDKEVREKVEMLVEQMAEQWGVTEELKMRDQMEWVSRMNNIKNIAEEMVLLEIIYA